jgi:uncharacterized protein (DUF58 family)
MKPLSTQPLPIDVSSGDLARAARLLVVRSQREATGLFAGNYVSAFRGSGIEFEESRPYVAGDDIRTLDWNATARAGEPFVKRYREERNQTLLFGLDVSSSMRFGTTGPTKAATAVHALALTAAAAGRAGDASGLVAFDSELRGQVAVGRGMAHTWSLIRFAVASARRSEGTTQLASGLRALRVQTRRRSIVILFSDFRDESLLPPREPSEMPAPRTRLRSELTRLARAHDVIAAVPIDPREIELPKVGMIRVEDPEQPGASFIMNTQSRRARARYRDACESARRRLDTELRRSGVETLWLRTDRSPLYSLGRFFRERANRRSRIAA